MTKPIRFFAPLDFILGLEEDVEKYNKTGKSFSRMICEYIREGRKIIKEREEEIENEKDFISNR